MNSHGGRNGERTMMEEDLFSNGILWTSMLWLMYAFGCWELNFCVFFFLLSGLTNGLRPNLEPNGETSGKRNFLRVLVLVKEKHGMYRLAVNVRLILLLALVKLICRCLQIYNTLQYWLHRRNLEDLDPNPCLQLSFLFNDFVQTGIYKLKFFKNGNVKENCCNFCGTESVV